jgi:hypothetical protein
MLAMKDLTIPTVTELKSQINFPYTATFNGKNSFAKRLKRYNNANNTTHSFTSYLPKGFTETYKLELKPSYLSKEGKKNFRLSKVDVEKGEVYSTVYEPGVDTIIPEDKVAILGINQYESYGDIFGTYEDALNNADKELEKEVYLPKIETKQLKIDKKSEAYRKNTIVPTDEPELIKDIENLDLSPAFYQYVYENGSKKLSKEQHDKAVHNIVIGMQDTHTGAEILETIKCI